MKSMSSIWLYSGFGDQGSTYTQEYNFPPSYGIAQASLYYAAGGGLLIAGIAGYRYRPDPNGQEQSVNFGDIFSWPAYIYVDNLTSVTFGAAAGNNNQDCKVLGNVFFW